MLKTLFRRLFFEQIGVWYWKKSLRILEEMKLQLASKNSVHILGNGPSLAKLDVNSLSDQDIVIACNHFYQNKISQVVRVDFYCASDPRLFFPIDWAWVKNVERIRPAVLVIPHKFFYIKYFYRGKVIFYNYAGHLKLWEYAKPTFNLAKALPTGDTVICDISIPLAAHLDQKKFRFSGIDLTHGVHGVQHSYSDEEIKSRRQSDHYLQNQWPIRTRKSMTKQLSELRKTKVELECNACGTGFSQMVENL